MVDGVVPVVTADARAAMSDASARRTAVTRKKEKKKKRYHGHLRCRQTNSTTYDWSE